MQNIAFTTKSPKETQAIARLMAQELKRAHVAAKGALVIGLVGDLGGGKTTFTQGFARGLGVKGRVLSPTFVLLKRFPLRGASFKNFIHIDAYRVESSREIAALGWKEFAADEKNIILVEWADKIKKLLPKNTIFVYFEHVDDTIRNITVKHGR